MSAKEHNANKPGGEIILYQAEDGQTRIECRFAEKTVWLTQRLLADLYQCAQNGGGGLVAAFPTKLNQAVCAKMIDYMKRDRIGVLIEAGLPEGTQIAHKHGWISGPSGIIQNISDAAIVYTPGGNYVLTIYIYHPVQAVWEPISGMFAKISEAVYNYYNLSK